MMLNSCGSPGGRDYPGQPSGENTLGAREAQPLAALRRGAFAAFFLLLAASAASAQNPDAQVDFTLRGTVARPANGVEAAATLASRKREVVEFLACGLELDFLSRVLATDRTKSNGETINLAIAKMYWYAGLPDQDGKSRVDPEHPACIRSVVLNDGLIPPPGAGIDYRVALEAMSMADDPLSQSFLNENFIQAFGDACGSVITGVHKLGPDFEATFEVSRACLRAQLNKALGQVEVTGQMGTGAGMPCHVFGTLSDDDGNWDFSIRSLIRALYLDRFYTRLHPNQRQFPTLLVEEVRQHIRRDLILTEPALGLADYPITGCGNTEHATGDASDRVDDDGFLDDAGDTLGDILDWLLKHWYISYPALAPLLGSSNALITVIEEALATGNAIVQETRIPETENHRLMIESTRYLNNALMRDDLAAGGDTNRVAVLDDLQEDVRDWLLRRLQEILRDDFTEYNARPYQRESIAAILNLYDFAPDEEVRTAAHLVLEYSFAKYAVGSNQSRRLVPYRRHMEAIADPLEMGASVLVPAKEADHQVALGLMYTGQTQQLEGGRASNLVPPEAAFGAFSWYQPNKIVLDLAIDKSTKYFQRFRHASLEAYSSGKGYLITAGGLRDGYASTVLGLGDANDMGAAVPTTVMFPSGTGRTTMASLLGFRGIRTRVKGSFPPSKAQVTYDHNACLASGFACGMNINIPDDLQACLQPGPANREPFWYFLRTKTCPGYLDGPPVYLVLYQRPCGAAANGCDSFGFLEAVDVDGIDNPERFEAFKSGVLERNPTSLVAVPPFAVAGGGGGTPTASLPSTYVASDGRRIEFDVTEHIRDDDRTGLKAIDGHEEPKWEDWKLAEGDLIQKNDWPLVTIKNPRFPGVVVTLDFRGRKVPKFDGP